MRQLKKIRPLALERIYRGRETRNSDAYLTLIDLQPVVLLSSTLHYAAAGIPEHYRRPRHLFSSSTPDQDLLERELLDTYEGFQCEDARD
jgi:hypothetical protein